MRRALDVTADLVIDHGGDRLRLIGGGGRLRFEIPTLRAALALRRAGAARLFSSPPVAAVRAASDVPIDLWLGDDRVGEMDPDGRTSLSARVLGLRGATLEPLALMRAVIRWAFS